MAGNTSCCSHVGAVLFALEYASKLKESESCTSKQCSWLPTYIPNAPMQQVRDCDFTSASAKHKRLLDNLANSSHHSAQQQKPTLAKKLKSSPAEFQQFLEDVKKTSECALFRIVPQYCQEYKPKEVSSPLYNIFDKDAASLPFEDLLKKCEVFSSLLKMSPEEVDIIEKQTRQQSTSKEWKIQRIGKITASKARDVCVANIENPGMSTLQEICYPFDKTFQSAAMKQGIQKESLAFAAYERHMSGEHQNFKASKPGFRHYQEKPFLGASLDVVTECDCCGKSAAELKCPVAQDNYTRNGKLPNTHRYYYQVQMQMLVLNIPHCDFVVYRDNEPLAITEVQRDGIVIQEIIVKGTIYFERVIPPELIGRYFTTRRVPLRAPLRAIQNQQPQAAQKICSCQKPSDGRVIICSRVTCTVKIFHMRCVNMKKKLKRWLCPSCKGKL